MWASETGFFPWVKCPSGLSTLLRVSTVHSSLLMNVTRCTDTPQSFLLNNLTRVDREGGKMKERQRCRGKGGNCQVRSFWQHWTQLPGKLKAQIYPTRIVNEDGKACCQLWTGARSGQLINNLKHQRGHSSPYPVMPPGVIKAILFPGSLTLPQQACRAVLPQLGSWSTTNQRSSMPSTGASLRMAAESQLNLGA